MAIKDQTMYSCSTEGCSYSTRKYFAQCPRCKNYNTAVQTEVSVDSGTPKNGLKTSVKSPLSQSKKLSSVSRIVERESTEINELDRVLGGGFVKSEVLLLGGEPGAGKSTLSLMLSNEFAKKNLNVIYFSGEESPDQIGLRADRMGVKTDNISVVHTSSLNEILGHIRESKPDLFIIDSLQTVASSELNGSLGSIQQSKEAANSLSGVAKELSIRAVLVSQVTKDGEFAGSESIQHIVDCVLFFESHKDSPLKFLRAYKNRFGSTEEVGIFQHSETGLEQVADPSGILSTDDYGISPGTAYTVVSEGIRQIPVEIQALAVSSAYPNPQKQFNGVDYNRGRIISAILEKFCNTQLFDTDVFVSTLSGMRVKDTFSDLAVAASILSSLRNITPKKKTVFLGELSLTGQVRGVHNIESKIKEAQRMGFEKAVIPFSSRIDSRRFKDIEIVKMKNIADLSKNI